MTFTQDSGRRERWNGPAEEARLAGSVLSQTRQLADDLGRVIASARRPLQQTISAHPYRALGISFAAGVLLGWIIKRS